ncbi:DUF1003 domain-containing protein [Bergeyella sp. RCAD1439]|uniref:DUF1003 domain-containing protein n=1 Tax=Bergeyella anatis TaxID=3113737 RepID=UPI002E16EC51|nr:DUF1003 domain-containing protein [Bergeyella sp. RCAD1439]
MQQKQNHTAAELDERIQAKIGWLERVANSVMLWVGSVSSLVVHTLLFIAAFLLPVFGWVPFDTMLLTLTTILSLEAIYLAIFIQMSVNKSNEHIEVLKEDVEEINENIEDIQEDIEEINEDIHEELGEDDEHYSEKARTVMLKSKVSNNKNNIDSLKSKMDEIERLLNKIRQENTP